MKFITFLSEAFTETRLLQKHDHQDNTGPTWAQKGSVTSPSIHPAMQWFYHDHSEHAYRLLFWPWLMYFSAEDAVALFRWTVMLLKALSQRIDRGRIGWRTGGGHARERAGRPSSTVLWRAERFSACNVWPYSLLKAGDQSADTGSHKCVLQTGYLRLVFHWIHIYEKISPQHQCVMSF